MKNADEHAKLLAQLAELERNSVNYFDVEREFFLIDSNNLHTVRPRLYGYSIQTTGIYENDNLTEEAVKGLDGRGCYVYVEVKDGRITIKQDLNGCWGIYLFRHGDYFALSNSFFRLLDHVKFKYPLTVNRDYCHYLMINELCSHAYSETAINEIQLLDRSNIIYIDIAKKHFDIELIDYREHTVSLDSKEGIAILDHWIEFWGGVLRGIAQNTNFIQTDLSGGFDTRIALIILLNSGIDCNKIRINSYTNDLHTHKEDYEIASQIAARYGFKLNQLLPVSQALNYSLSDVLISDEHCRQLFHKDHNSSPPKKYLERVYHLTGGGGEVIRFYWHKSSKQFTEEQILKANRYSLILSRELADSVKTTLNSAFSTVCRKYKTKDYNFIELPQLLYTETRCRSHFGKHWISNFLQNRITLSPMIDPQLSLLRLNTLGCSDFNLLLALIFTRYEPDLLKFPFEGKRSIAPETIEYAKKINERFLIYHKRRNNLTKKRSTFHLPPRDLQAKKILSSSKNNPNIPDGLFETCLKAAFESSRTYGLFTAYFDEELYQYAANYYETHVFGRSRPMYAIVGVAKVLEDVEISQRNHLPYRDMQRFLEQDFCKIHNTEQVAVAKFKNYFTARIDVKLLSTAGDFQILSVSDDMVNISKPKWFQKNGTGYVIQSYYGNLEFVAKTTVDGKINLHLKGLDIRNPDNSSERLSYWIDYTKLIVNGKVVFDKLTPAWHDKPYAYNMDAKAGEEIKVQVEWLPHRDTSTAIAPPKEPQKKTDEAVDKTNNNSTARVDIKLFPKGEGDFQILDVSDDRAEVLKPAWFNKDGIGYKVQSFAGKIEFIAKTTADGQIKLLLRGIDVRTPEDDSKRIPYWIDYTKLTVNGKVVFDKLTPAWHDKAFSYNIDAKAGDEIKIQVEWLPHRSDV